MSTCFVVLYNETTEYDPGTVEVLGVFSTKEKAKVAIKEAEAEIGGKYPFGGTWPKYCEGCCEILEFAIDE